MPGTRPIGKAPTSSGDLPASSYALFKASADRHGEEPALSFLLDARSHEHVPTWSYRSLFAAITRTANMFHELGTRPGDVIAIMLPNLPETHFVLWGAEAAAIAMPVNPLPEADAIAMLLNAARACVLVTLSPFPGTDLYDKAVTIAAMVPTLRHVVLADLHSHARMPKRAVATVLACQAAWRADPVPKNVRVHRLARAVRRMPADRLTSRRRIAATDTASYFCTGGTTGSPKIAVRSHGQEVANAWMIATALGGVFQPGTTVLCGLPLFHVNAVIATGLAPLLAGARILLATPQGFRSPDLIDRFWQIVSHHRVTAFSGVPTLLNMLLERPVDGIDLSAFRCAFSGAAPLSPELLRRFEETCGVGVIEAYGLTETACAASINPVEGEHRAGSVGLPLPCQDIRCVILDGDGRYLADAARGHVGIVAIAGPNVFSGYLTPEHNAGLWIDRGDGRRWLNTGDLGRIDADGYLWLTGREKDLIIRGGHNIDPSMIEEALAGHPDVALSAAVGRPDAHAGEVPVAWVQLREGGQVAAEELQRYAAANIGERAAVPRRISIVDALPLTPIGKVHKPMLRRWEIEDAAREAIASAGIIATVEKIRAGDNPVIPLRIVAPITRHADIVAALRPFSFPYEMTDDE